MAGITVAALTTGLIVTCRPTLVNRPFACAMYKPALASEGTVATTRSGFSRPAGPAEPAALAWPPHAAAVTAIPATVTAARTQRHDRRPWPADTAVKDLAGTAPPTWAAAARLVSGGPQPAPSPGWVTSQDLSRMPESSADAVTAAGAVTGCVAFSCPSGRAPAHLAVRRLTWPCAGSPGRATG